MKTILCLLLCLVSASAPAQAQEKLPELVVTEVRAVPAHPVAGDTVRFSAVVKNQGTAPTPEGVVLGGVFTLDGAVAGYEDQYRHTLAPGESVILTANGGGGRGDGTWPAKAGKHALGFLVDDVHRIKVSSRAGSALTQPQPLEVAMFHGPDLVLRRLTWARAAGGRVIFGVGAANSGSEPLPAGGYMTTRIRVDGRTALSFRGPPPAPGGETAALSPPLRLTPGKHRVEAQVSGPSGAAERRTDNNTLKREIWEQAPLLLRAAPADALADSVGVCVHLSYYDTTYGRYPLIKQRLVESGIRTVREGAELSNTDVIGKLKELGAMGIKTDLIVDPHRVSPAQAVQLVKTLGKAVITVEGPNEPNLFYSDLFPDGIRDYQQKLYAALKADPQTAMIPVLSPALAFPAEIAARIGPVACDYGALHPYPGGQLPDAGLDDTLRATRIVAPGKPVMTTETGYDTATQVTSGQPGVSEAAAAKYMPRLLLEAFRRGIRRSFFYEFADERPEPGMHDAEQHFGLIRSDGTPKPSFAAVADLIRLFSDPGPAPASGTLAVQMSGDVSDLRSVLFQKRDGRRLLVLWVNGRSYDQDTRADAAVPMQRVTVTFGQPIRGARLYRPSRSGRALAAFGAATMLTLDVPDEPLVVEIR